MDQPDWATIKAANAAYSAMIAAWWGAIATTLAMIFAGLAARWAGAAVKEAGKQAKAAIESVKWSEEAAKAAQSQISILQRQLRLAEPRPVVVLTITYQGAAPQRSLKIDAENVGDDLAFDVDLSPLEFDYAVSAGMFTARMAFHKISVLKASSALAFSRDEPTAIADPPTKWVNSVFSRTDTFLHKLMEEGSRKSIYSESYLCATLKLKYRNLRGAHFSQEYEVIGTESHDLASRPIGSLVREDE